MEINNINNIYELPEECLSTIFSFLEPKDLGQITQVCKLWERVSSDNVVWKYHCSEKVKKLQRNSLKGKVRTLVYDAKDKIQFVIENEDSTVTGLFGGVFIFFPKELIDLLKKTEIKLQTKLEELKKFLNGKETFLMKTLNPINSSSLEIMLKAGINPNLYDTSEFETPYPLMLAANYGYEKEVELLLKYGADPRLTNHRGETALDRAGRKNRENKEAIAKIKELLTSHLNKSAHFA